MMPASVDKNPVEIKYLLALKGLTFAEVDRRHGLPDGTARNAARRPHEAGERAIAKLLNVAPIDIWPKRFDAATGERLQPQPLNHYRPSPQMRARQKAGAA